MMFRSSCLLAILLSTADAFAFTIRSRTTAAATTANNNHVANVVDFSSAPLRRSICLNMAAEEETTSEEPTGETTAEDDVIDITNNDDTADAAANDILSSPAFLKRKLEVLETDIATADEDLAAASERKAVAKEEWGPQLEALQREVSRL